MSASAEATLGVRCPAKINLMLKVLRRRADGYHELDTVFQSIDLWDELEWRPAAELSLSCDDPSVPTDDSNLVLKAARLLAARCEAPTPQGELVLRKAIPVGAGLGGGSSDASGTLRLCARAWGLRSEEQDLSALGAELGADVPYFLVGGTARGRGRGDRITPLAPLPESPLLLGFPPYGISTAEVFGRVACRLTLPQNGVSLPVRFAHKWREEKDFALAVNDLEAVVFEGWPELARFRDALRREGALRAMLSGSGSTVFGVFQSTSQRDSALERLRGRYGEWTLLATRSVSHAVQFVH